MLKRVGWASSLLIHRVYMYTHYRHPLDKEVKTMHYKLRTILHLSSQAGYVTLPPATMDHNRALLKPPEEISILLSVKLRQLWSEKVIVYHVKQTVVIVSVLCPPSVARQPQFPLQAI